MIDTMDQIIPLLRLLIRLKRNLFMILLLCLNNGGTAIGVSNRVAPEVFLFPAIPVPPLNREKRLWLI